MGENTNDAGQGNRDQQQQQNNPQQNNPNQQNRQGEAIQGGQGERIDTDGDGRTRDPSDTSPTDNGGREQR